MRSKEKMKERQIERLTEKKKRELDWGKKVRRGLGQHVKEIEMVREIDERHERHDIHFSLNKSRKKHV